MRSLLPASCQLPQAAPAASPSATPPRHVPVAWALQLESAQTSQVHWALDNALMISCKAAMATPLRLLAVATV